MRISTLAALTAAIATLAVATADARPATMTVPPAASPPAVTSTAPEPDAFAHPVANPWFPLVPGTTTVLRGTDEGERLRERVHVTHRTVRIQHIATRAVRDVLRRADGTLAERTTDWYAADDAGNVWYFGERTATFDQKGELESREGSWRAGVRGAHAGLIMPADPGPTDAYRQELFRGHAEDQAWIVGFKRSERTPMHRFRHVLRTFEWTRLEPRVMSAKLYARGVGIIRERDIAGGEETFAVVAVHRR
jgi:hypothetical protein